MFSLHFFAVLSFLTLPSSCAFVKERRKLTVQQEGDKFAANLIGSISIDWNNRPYYDVGITSEPTCWPHVGACSTTFFFNRFFLENVTNIIVNYTTNYQYNQYNYDNIPTVLTFTESTAQITSTTTGWTIGAQLSVTGGTPKEGAQGQLALQLSASYSDITTSSTTETTEVSEQVTCDPGYQCGLDTLTFFAYVQGLCYPEPWITCQDTYTVCGTDEVCPQYQDYGSRCSEKPEPTNCTVQVPLKSNDGTPVTLMIPTGTPASST